MDKSIECSQKMANGTGGPEDEWKGYEMKQKKYCGWIKKNGDWGSDISAMLRNRQTRKQGIIGNSYSARKIH